MHIVAVGARCAVGLTAEYASAAIRAGISRVAEHPFLLDVAGDKVRCGRVPRIDPTVIGTARLAALAEYPLRDVAAKLTRVRPSSVKVPVLLALPEARPGWTTADTVRASQTLAEMTIPNIGTIAPEQVGGGHAGALSAMRLAFEIVASGREDFCIAGGVDTYLDANTIGWLDVNRRLAREGARTGFAPGEGAAMVALASDGARKQLGLPSLGLVRGVACAQESRAPDRDEESLGQGLTDAILGATDDLRMPNEIISDVYCDINGERVRTEDWGFTLMRTSARFRDGTSYVTAVGQCGDLGAASGALGCVLAVQAWQRRFAIGPRALIWGGSWGGLRGAALLEQGER